MMNNNNNNNNNDDGNGNGNGGSQNVSLDEDENEAAQVIPFDDDPNQAVPNRAAPIQASLTQKKMIQDLMAAAMSPFLEQLATQATELATQATELKAVKKDISGIQKVMAPAVVYSLLETAVYIVMLKHNYVHTVTRGGGVYIDTHKLVQKASSFANWALSEMLGLNVRDNGDPVTWGKMRNLVDNDILHQQGMSGLLLFLECSTSDAFNKWLKTWPPQRNIVAHGYQFLLAMGQIQQATIASLGPAVALNTIPPLSTEQVDAAVKAMLLAHDGDDASYFIAGPDSAVDQCRTLVDGALASSGSQPVDDAKIANIKSYLN